LLRQKQKKLIMLPSETMIWQPEFTDKTLSRKPGAVQTFRWKDGDMDLSMKNRDFSPLIGRTGIELGKTFSGKDWSVTARAGTSWQFDLLNNGETVLRDASGEKRIKGEKDSRMLFNVGMNAQIKDNMRFGLEFEKSAFGKYNVDNAVNANFRYMF
ncbi:autotransporter outer membrane beta-barrel domain-containing protein, partial [Escherichia coli]|uniref:autotransporter outer membrane beta-barrel domain-containing protein n=1 Tax=Escherichia coli TaxID=562 RepID=UPI00209B771D